MNHADADNFNATFNTNTQESIDVSCVTLQEDLPTLSEIDDCKKESEVRLSFAENIIIDLREHIAKQSAFIKFIMRVLLFIGAFILFYIAKICAIIISMSLGFFIGLGFMFIALIMMSLSCCKTIFSALNNAFNLPTEVSTFAGQCVEISLGNGKISETIARCCATVSKGFDRLFFVLAMMYSISYAMRIYF